MENGVLWADIEAMRGNKSFMLSPVILNKNGIKVWKQPAFTLDGVNYVPAMTETFVSSGRGCRCGKWLCDVSTGKIYD